MSEQPLTLEDVTVVKDDPLYSPYGYLITEDGTVHALTRKWTHGLVLTILFPEMAQREGYSPPVQPFDDNNVFAYQQFELDHQENLNVIRVATGRLMGEIAISKGDMPASDAAIEGLRQVFSCLGLQAQDRVETNHRGMSVTHCLTVAMKKDDRDECDTPRVAVRSPR